MKSKIVFFFTVLLTISVYRNVHAQANSLYIRVSKSLVQPGESYILYVVQDKATAAGYTGLLDVQSTVCSASDPANCSTTIGSWGDYFINNGSAVIDLPSDIGAGIYKARFKPRDSNWGWSNEIQVNIGTTFGLEDATTYWIMPEESVVFHGMNYISRTPFTTKIGYLPLQNMCGSPERTMYFMKDKKEGYWDPFPWRPGEQNLLWHLIPWQKNTSWHDEYLTARGDERFKYNPTNPFDFEANFQEKISQYRYDSINPEFPAYILAPHWLGTGWGLSNTHKYTLRDASIPFCSIQPEPGASEITWVVHGDIVNINLPKYQGPALRLKYYEADPRFLREDAYALREDWYFIKNIGLVKIDVKYFGTRVDGAFAFRLPCLDDPDCLTNEVMSEPHVTLTRAEYLSPSFSLSLGWNQIVWLNVSNYTAKTALEDIDNDCRVGTAVAIAKKEKDWWESYVKNYGGRNFDLQNNQNYLIMITKSCSWVP